MTRRYVFVPVVLVACATARESGPGIVTASGPPLPNASMETAAPLTRTVEATGALACGQTAWYRLSLGTASPVTVTIHGQAQENALGATTSVVVLDAAGNALGRLLVPVFARSPNWDPREERFPAVPPGTYFFRVEEEPDGCQRVSFRLLIQ